MLGLIQAETMRIAEWQTFPWGPLFTAAAMASSVILYALSQYFRRVFLAREEATALANSLREKLKAMEQRIDKLDAGCDEANRTAEEAFRLAQLADRAIGEQWKRVSEEIISPVKEMSRDLRETREMLVKYVQTQDGHARELERLERRVNDRERPR